MHINKPQATKEGKRQKGDSLSHVRDLPMSVSLTPIFAFFFLFDLGGIAFIPSPFSTPHSSHPSRPRIIESAERCLRRNIQHLANPCSPDHLFSSVEDTPHDSIRRTREGKGQGKGGIGFTRKTAFDAGRARSDHAPSCLS